MTTKAKTHEERANELIDAFALVSFDENPAEWGRLYQRLKRFNSHAYNHGLPLVVIPARGLGGRGRLLPPNEEKAHA